MSFVTSIRDYVEVLNTLVSGDLNLLKLGQHTLFYFFQTILYILSYIISFQWFRDLSNLPIIIPQISFSILKENLIFDIVEGKSTLPNFSIGSFSFFQTPTLETNKFFIGFLNSFFLCLPIYCSNLIIFRRLLVQGIPAGIAAALGSISSQVLFLATIFFGLRFFLIPWLSLDSLQYLLGLFIILGTVYSMSHEVQLTRIKSSAVNVLFKVFAINFVLSWTEQSCIFQYIGNLTFSSEPTILETLATKNQIDSFLINISYLFGILVGSLFFSFIFCFLAYRFFFFIINFTGALYSESIERINFILITVIIGLSLASVPFYGLDYLITKPLGFVSQDQALEKTLFYPGLISKSASLYIHGNYYDAPRPEEPHNPALDEAPLDRGRYLDLGPFGPFNTFENLNFQGEYAWQKKEMHEKAPSEPNQFLLNLLKKTDKSQPDKSQKDLPLSSDIQTSETFEPEKTILGIAGENFLYTGSLRESDDIKKEKEIKEKYYSNPVYKRLLDADIDSFLLRQPSAYSLTAEDEKNLFEKRLLLADYYDSLRLYQEWIKDKEEVEDKNKKEFHGSRSYADRIYNQQFKGTIDIVRRLFAITIDESENPSNTRVLKYDQPLYKDITKKGTVAPGFHEEVLEGFNSETALPFRQKFSGLKKFKEKFFEPATTKPFYAGWDDDQRKFIITNRFLPYKLAGYSLPGENLNSKDLFDPKKVKQSQGVEFTAWPLFRDGSEAAILDIPYKFLFQVENPETRPVVKIYEKQPLEQDIITELKSKHLPTNVFQEEDETKKPSSLFDIVAPKRGGFIWPGNNALKIKNISTYFDFSKKS